MQLAMTDLKLQILENVTSPFKLRRMNYKCHCPAGFKLKGPFPGPVPEYDRKEADEATMEHYYCQKVKNNIISIFQRQKDNNISLS